MNNSNSYRNRWGWLVAAVWAGAMTGWAAMPEAPYVAPIKTGDAWEVELVPAEKKKEVKEGVPLLRAISGKRADQARYEKFVWANKESDRWLIGRTQFDRGDDGRYVATRFARGAASIEQRLSELPELTWVAPTHFKGIAKVEDRDCYYYEYTEVAPIYGDDEGAAKGEPAVDVYHRKAWIDVATKRPVVFENDDYRYVYTFSSFSPAELSPPGEITATLTNP